MKDKQKLYHIIIFTIIYIFIILFITKFGFYFASVTDNLKQHAIFPDYFRNLFYETKNLMPNFAPHLGGGQNIFYFIYYGYLNPIILLSYLMPFISMKTYILGSTLILNYISILLMYHFLNKNKFNKNTSFIATLLFLFASPIIFHSHRHIMFISYIPFLLLALINTYNYFTKNKSFLLILNITLLIFTSFYFSISSIIVISLYALFLYLKLSNFTFKLFIKDAFKFIFRILIAVLISSLIILPTIYIILNSQRTNTDINILSSLIPHINENFILYNSYGLGLTSISIIALIYGILNKKKNYKILSILLFIIISIPLFNMLLNGGLYLNGKAFIPLLPLFILLIANLIDHIKNNNFNYKFFILLLIFSILITKNKTFIMILIDLIISLIFLYLYSKNKNSKYLTPILIISFIICLFTNSYDNLINFKTLKDIKEIDKYNYLDNDNNIYRYENYLKEDYHLNYSKAHNDYLTTIYSSTINPYYQNSFYNDFNNNDRFRNKFMLAENNNLFFEHFMGVKYILTNKNIPYGYHLVHKENKGGFYQNDNVNKIGFSTSNIIGEKEYNTLDFNKKLEIFGKYIIVKNYDKLKYPDNFLSKRIYLEYETETKNIRYQNINNTTIINAKDEGFFKLNLKETIDTPLIIRFNVKPSDRKDIQIIINGITNKLTNKTWKYYNHNETFDYILSSNEGINNLNIKFNKGIFEINNIEVYSIAKEYFDSYQDNKDYLNITNKISDTLYGNINVKNDGYFIFTIPYDEGFKIFVDNKEVNYELVNKSFIGFKIKKGNHNIKLEFSAPCFKEGKIISIIGICLLLIILHKEKKPN